jgi:Hemerythrin HHE cation binding domain
MKKSEIRGVLLTEHAHLRKRIDEVRSTVRMRGRRRRIALRAAVDRLGHELHEHTRNEEKLLRGLLRDVDAWGPVREEIMAEGHLAEHREIIAAAIEAIVVCETSAKNGVLSAILDRILDHLTREEVVLLAEDVLCDDGAPTDVFTG